MTTTTTTTKKASKTTPQADNNASRENPVYKYVTDRVIAALEKDTVPWNSGYTSTFSLPINAKTGTRYRGINIFVLTMTADEHEYTDNLWLTYNQAADIGCHVRKGEKSPAQVFFYKLIDKRTQAEKDECTRLSWRDQRKQDLMKKVYRVLRYTNVFNIAQVEAPTEKAAARLTLHKPEARTIDHDPIKEAQEIIDNYQHMVEIITRDQPAYSPSADKIYMPHLNQYDNPGRYYKTLFHETAHSTGHESRLDRAGVSGFDYQGSQQYSQEELIAEMAAAMLIQIAGINTADLEQNTAAYIKGWLSVLKNDPKFVVQAATAASQAADYIQNITYGDNDNE